MADEAQGAIEQMVRRAAVCITGFHELDCARCGADQLHALRMDQRRRNGHPERQGKPRQRKASKQTGVAQGIHGANYR